MWYTLHLSFYRRSYLGYIMFCLKRSFDMRYRAQTLKTYISMEISPLGWATLITRALPELLEHNSRFSAYHITKRTLWSETEIDIINWYFNKMYQKEMPAHLLISCTYQSNNHWSISNLSISQAKKQWSRNARKIFNCCR